MRLSPFKARAALILFLAIGTGIAWNLLAFQSSADTGAAGQNRVKRPAFRLDAARLTQMAKESLGAPAGEQEPAGAAIGAPQPLPREPVGGGGRIGSFSPSSGQIALATLPGADPGEARRATVKEVQIELERRGYHPGEADGVPGLVTRAAVLAYEHDQGLPLTADPSPEVLAHLRHGTSAPGAVIGQDPKAMLPAGHAERVIRSIQQALGQLGYLPEQPNGLATEETVRAIREYEMDAGLVPTGRVSGPLMARLTRTKSPAQARRKP